MCCKQNAIYLFYLNLTKKVAVKLWQLHVEVMDEEILFSQKAPSKKSVSFLTLMGWLCPAADLLNSSVIGSNTNVYLHLFGKQL